MNNENAQARNEELPVSQQDSEPTGAPEEFGFPPAPTLYETKRWSLQQLFLAEFSKRGLMYEAAEAAGCSARSAENWIQADSFGFQKRFAAAQQVYLEKMEKEADRRAIEGVDKPVYQGGKEVGTIKVYSDNLLMFRMKKLDPSYRDSFNLVLDTSDTKGVLDELRRIGEARPAVVEGSKS